MGSGNQQLCSAESQVLRLISEAYEQLPPNRYFACNRPGTLPNPIRVVVRSHERSSAVFRFIVMKVVEKGLEALLTPGNRVTTSIDGIEGIGAPSLIDFGAVDRAHISAIALAVGGQVSAGQWFYLAGDSRTLYFLDRSEVIFPFDEVMNTHRLHITKIRDSTGKISKISRTMSEILAESMAKQREFDALRERGLAI